MGAYDTVSLGIPYKFEGGPVGKKIPNLGSHGPPGVPWGPQGTPGTWGPLGVLKDAGLAAWEYHLSPRDVKRFQGSYFVECWWDL